jgi:hypothetical protein
VHAQAAAETRITTDASMGAQAERALNKAVNSFQYDGDLVQDVENETVKIENVKTENLPEDMQKMSVAERKKVIDKRIAERKAIRAEILTLSKQRDEYVAAERAKAGRKNGFDTAVAQALKEQLAKKGIR